MEEWFHAVKQRRASGMSPIDDEPPMMRNLATDGGD